MWSEKLSSNLSFKGGKKGELGRRRAKKTARREKKLKGKRKKEGGKKGSKSCNVLGGLIRAKIKCHTELCSSIDGFYSKSHHPVNPL